MGHGYNLVAYKGLEASGYIQSVIGFCYVYLVFILVISFVIYILLNKVAAVAIKSQLESYLCLICGQG